MRYLRCQCGAHEAWTSGESWPECQGCDKCHTTLAGSPKNHGPIQPHVLGEATWEVDRKTGERWQVRACTRSYLCRHKERVVDATS